MSREAYQAPTFINDPTAGAQQSGFGGGAAAAGGTAGAAGGAVDRGTPYTCGDCNARVVLKRGDAVRCKECGYRVLYKERTTRVVQFEAR